MHWKEGSLSILHAGSAQGGIVLSKKIVFFEVTWPAKKGPCLFAMVWENECVHICLCVHAFVYVCVYCWRMPFLNGRICSSFMWLGLDFFTQVLGHVFICFIVSKMSMGFPTGIQFVFVEEISHSAASNQEHSGSVQIQRWLAGWPPSTFQLVFFFFCKM